MKISLKSKSAVMLLCMAMVLIGAGGVICYQIYSNNIFSSYKKNLQNLTKTEAVMLDKEAVAVLKEDTLRIYRQICEETGGVPDFDNFTDEEWDAYFARYEEVASTAEYRTVMDTLNDFMDTNDTSSVYLCYTDTETQKDIYLIDSERSVDPCPTGTCDDIAESMLPRVQEGEFDLPAYITNFEEYGWLCTASTAIHDEDGNVLAGAFADISMNDVMQDRQDFLLKLCIALVVIAGAMTLLMIFAVNKTVVSPIKLVSQEAERFVHENNRISEILPTVHTKDEIQDLSAAILRMEEDINQYIDNLTKVTAEKERIGAELDVATHIQASMLPCIFPAFPDRKEFDIYATMNPAKEVGGDFYDFFMVDERHLAIVMADVSGKGVPAALFMVIGKTLIKDHTEPGEDLGEVFTEVNDMLCESNSEGLFITAFEGVLDLMTGEFMFVNAGHEMPFIQKAGGAYTPYKIRAGFVLAGMEGMRYKAGSMKIAPGDRIFQYTDGVTEATNAQNELYGMERLETVLTRNADKRPDELLPAVKADIDAFVGEAPQFDDITMLCLEFKEYMVRETDAESQDAQSAV